MPVRARSPLTRLHSAMDKTHPFPKKFHLRGGAYKLLKDKGIYDEASSAVRHATY